MTKDRTLTNAVVVPLRQRRTDGDRLVAVDAIGEPIRPDAYSDAFIAHARAAGLPPLRLHDLRHSTTSILLQQGVPVVVVARLAGHDRSVTMRTYAHAQDAAMEAAVSTLGNLYAAR